MQILGARPHAQGESIRSHFILTLITAQQEAAGSTVQWCSKKQAKPFNPGSKWSEPPLPSVRSHRWNRKGCYDNGTSRSGCCATRCAPIFKCFQFLCNYYICGFPLRGQSIAIQPATTQISISSCGDDKTISLLFQFSNYSNTGLSPMLHPPESRVFRVYAHDDASWSWLWAIVIFLHKHRKQINMWLRRTQWNLYMQWKRQQNFIWLYFVYFSIVSAWGGGGFDVLIIVTWSVMLPK